MRKIINTYKILIRNEFKQLLNLWVTVSLLLTIFPLSSCSQEFNSVSNNSKLERKINVTDNELERNRILWQERKIFNYNIVVSKMTMGTLSYIPTLIQVRNGQAISKKPIEKPGPMTRIYDYEDFETVEKTFDTIKEDYHKEHKLNVTYNAEFGYPEKIVIDPNPGATDQTFIITFDKFEILNTE